VPSKEGPLIPVAITNYHGVCEFLFYYDFYFLFNLITTKFFIRKKESKDRLRKPIKCITSLKDGFLYSQAYKILS
jgi:hypothetical protein